MSPLPALPVVELLACPKDHTSPLTGEGDDLVCPTCQTRFPVRDGVVSFLSAQQLSEQEARERDMRDEESEWYDPMFVGYTNAVEVPASIRRIGHPTGPILDAGCGTGRITEALVKLGQPVIAVDYSEACLRLMQARTAGGPVLAVQSDLRALPVRSDAMSAATCVEVYPHIRPADRTTFLEELRRVLTSGGVLSITAYNYNLLFKAWNLLGNDGAREGKHMLGGDYYYVRMTKDEFRKEVEAVFDVEEVAGIRNIPARSIAEAVRRVGLRRAGDKFLDFMVEKGHKADFALEPTPVASAVGFSWVAKARKG
jgi:ubiquinone/menaquinone biosynthesis C-methylase UbiE